MQTAQLASAPQPPSGPGAAGESACEEAREPARAPALKTLQVAVQEADRVESDADSLAEAQEAAQLQPMVSLRDAARDAVPVIIGYVTLGIAAGMLLVANGLAWWWAPVWSLIIYSGTMQMLLGPLAGAGASLASIAASTVFVSGRHTFYGLGFPLDRVQPRRARGLLRLYAIHAITDEVYALLASKDSRRMSTTYVLGVEAISQFSWLVGTTAGAFAGTWLARLVGERISLLGFVLTSLFVVLVIENWRAHPDRAVLALGVVAGALGIAIGGSVALLAALGFLAVGLMGLYAWRRRGAGAAEDAREGAGDAAH